MIRKPVVGSDVHIDELQSEEDATQANTCSAITEEDMDSLYSESDGMSLVSGGTRKRTS